jgi:hypothetical protein
LAYLDKPTLTEEDLQGLVDNAVMEDKTLDYKVQGYGGSDDDKREFLRDVTSFANTAGGHIIIGMEETDGKATALPGVSLASVDDEILRLENVLRDGVKRRIPRVEIRPIPLAAGSQALVIRIPQSWDGPHMVTFKNLSQFWARNSNGKYQLDVDEIRSAFRVSEGLSEAVRNFRTDRIAKIVANETTALIRIPPRIIIHIMPFSAFAFNGSKFDAKQLYNREWTKLYPIGGMGASPRVNFDGLVVWTATGNDMETKSYVQVFRNGIVEAVTCSAFGAPGTLFGEATGRLASEEFEQDILKALPLHFEYLNGLGVEPPYILAMSLHGVKGYHLSAGFILGDLDVPHTLERNDLIIPEIIIESTDNLNFEAVLKPMFDSIWNAAGWPASQNYDASGKWVGVTRRR